MIVVKLEMFQKVRLKDGRKGHVIEIFNDGEAYMIDIKIAADEYEDATVYPSDIKSVFIEHEEPVNAL